MSVCTELFQPGRHRRQSGKEGQEVCSRVLGAVAKLRKATIIFVMSVRPPVRMTPQLPLDGFG